MAFLSERLLTHVAVEGSFSCVDTHVSLQATRLSEAFVTYLALMQFLTRMDKLVFIQISLSGERLIADVTHVHGCYGSVGMLTQKR